MGTSKAWLDFGGRPLLSILVERMLARFPEVLVAAAPGQELPPTPARIVYDERPGEGPLAGVSIGLREATRPLVFVASCDAPFLSPELAAFLAAQAGEQDVVVPEWEGRLHPLHAVYRASVRPVIERALDEGRRRVTDLFPLVRALTVPEAELRTIDPESVSFLNVNTPEEYRSARVLWEARQERR